jgi:uncharacterized cupredoxin-like copper-binding protein
MKFAALLAALLAIEAVSSAACAPAAPTDATIRFHYSHYEPSMLRVRAGVPVTITLRNDDPIDHEWIVGSEAVHQVHRHGTEAVHDQLPTEVTVPALSTRVTTVVFPAGEEQYICHLPGHEEYGMSGSLRAV